MKLSQGRGNIDVAKLGLYKLSTPQMRGRNWAIPGRPQLECSNPKKVQMLNERAFQIDRENQLLFIKMLDIYGKRSNSFNQNSGAYLPSTLNYKIRKDFQLRIADENQRLYSRIKSQHSEYSMKRMVPSYQSHQGRNKPSSQVMKFLRLVSHSKKTALLRLVNPERCGV